MRLAAFALFLLVLLTHYGAAPLADLAGGTERAWFYVLRGFEGAALFLVLGAALARGRGVEAFVCLWGAAEEGLTAACRLSNGIVTPAPKSAQCDAATGLPVYAILLCIVLWFLLRGVKEPS